MAIHTSSNTTSTTGFEKVIDSASMSLALDVMQKYQYQKPQQSTIRELAANAVDSIKEREIAKKILRGSPVSDFYITRDDAEFKASNFNREYFDLKWLDTKENAEIVYEESTLGKDRLIVRDSGVGLGGSRLEGYFKLNWSSKRNSKDAIGKFGMGAKAPLSTGVDFFRVVTRHNGKKFSFDVFSHKVDSVTEKFAKDGTINPSYTFENGYTCFYENTTELNGTEIIIDTKKHHRALYTGAVRSQLLYMPGIVYKIRNEQGFESEITTKAKIIYEDDNVILSDNNQYSRPHIVINNVCYQDIDFLELELESKNGNIGIKMDAENIDISPSREAVIWGDKTRAEVTKKFEEVREIASREVEKQLTEPDFGLWLVKCANVLAAGTSSNDILGRLSRVIDRAGLKPSFKQTGIKYKGPSELINGVSIRHVTYDTTHNYRTGKTTGQVSRSDMSSWAQVANGIYFTKHQANNTKDRYLNSLKSGFVLLTLPEILDEEHFKSNFKVEGTLYTKGVPMTADIAWQDYKAMFEKRQTIIDLLLTSSLAKDYDELVVPELFLKKLEEDGKEVPAEDGGTKVVELTPAEKRKLEEKVVCYYPKFEQYANTTNKKDAAGLTLNTQFSWVKYEPKIAEINEWENVIYSFSDEDEKLLTICWILMQQQTPKDKTPVWYMSNKNEGLKFIKIAKGLEKRFKQFTHVKEFFKEVAQGFTPQEDGKDDVRFKELRMHTLFTKWYTGKLINEQLESYKFLTNFANFSQEIADKYMELKEYEKDNYKDLSSYYKQNLIGCQKDAMDAIDVFAGKVLTLQLAVDGKQDDESIAELSKALFQEEFTNACAVDMDKYKQLQEVIEYAKPLQIILSQMPILAGTQPLSYDLESEIKEIMRNKGYDS